MEEPKDRVMALPQLQNLMKKDPEAYVPEFDQQWSHFESMLEMFKLKPQKPHSTFTEQVMFLAHVAPSFPTRAGKLPDLIIATMDEHFEIMHADMRQSLVQALMLLRNRDQYPCMRTLPLYFKLFSLQDKALRKLIFTHIVKDIVQMNKHGRNQKSNNELKEFCNARLQETDVEVARRGCAIFVSLYRQNVWRDAHVVNTMSAGLVHPDLKIAAALAHVFLGNKTKGLEGILEESDDEEGDAQEKDIVRGVMGSKKTSNREKKIARAKKALQKAKRKKSEKADNAGISFVAVDLLHDPQTLAERMLQRISKGGEPFLFRLLILHLIARIIGRHDLLILNLYPFLLKYLLPTQNEVTKVLACLVESCHSSVPPEELRPVVLHILKTFVTEVQPPEVIEVGLNTIREVCTRSVNILNEEELADLANFRKNKSKGVAMAARSLINTYRELHPELLHRSLRGKEATMAISRGELQAPQFGAQNVNDAIEGLDMLTAKKKRRSADPDDDGDAADRAEDVEAAKNMMSEQVLSPEDFKKLRKMRLQKSIEMQLGRKRKLEEMSSSSDSEPSEHEDDSSSEDISDGERGMPGRLPGAMSAGEIEARKKKAKGKDGRMNSIKAGRTDMKAKLLEQRASRRGGKTNMEHSRNKPMMMTMKSRDVRKKAARTGKQRVATLKKHIKTLKGTSNHPKKRRL